ncbi:MAG TPA: acyltransferase, partial [Anaerolineales bacterium]|nr:acyltransferase [Anaerolineales bacterium]
MNERVKELDGVRGIAIFVVVAFHLLKRADYFTNNEILHFISRLSSIGWVGVDIFFVLSGFLITSILLKTKAEKNYFKNFYIRRALRIFPLYFVFIAIILILIPKLDPDFVPEVPRALPFLLLYQQNWLMLFSKIPLTTYLAVTWSLAIEEQFYLIWPAVVYFTKKETLVKLSIGVILCSILARVLGILFWDDMSVISTFFYYNTFTRFEQLVL